MKRKFMIFIIIIVVLIIMIVSWYVKDVPIKLVENYRVISYNIKYAEEYLDNFETRKEMIVEQLLSYEADIISLQEANYGWMNDEGLPTLLKDYSYVGVGREDGDSQGEYVPIFYLKDKFEVLESNTIWLSETPNEVSIGWDASTYRIMTYVTLVNKETLEVLTIYNTHLDHEGSEAASLSVDLILNTIKKTDNPYILTGDFNTPSFFPNYFKITNLMDDSKNIADSSMKYGTINYNTNNMFLHFIRIDYVFVSEKDFKVINYRVDPTVYFEGKPISDHFPVIVDFRLSV